MKWLKDNPIGLVLVSASGVLLLVALVMAIVWTLPEAGEVAGTSSQEDGKGKNVVVTAHQAADISEYQVINDKPVFNITRLPEIEEDLDADEQAEDAVVEVTDAPDVRLTGVIMTPNMKIASLTPADSNQESIMAHEGQILEGEFVGWQIGSVGPRKVVLESRDGQKLDLELQVHDDAIKQPPKPVAPAQSAQTTPGEGRAPAVDGDGQPLSRAEEIRMRIAERREELRREQEIQQAKQGLQAQSDALRRGEAKAAPKPQDYQSAIQAMMKNKGKRSDDNEDG